MKTIALLFLVSLVSCTNGPYTKQDLARDAVDVGTSAALGYIEGGKAGASLGALDATARGLKRARTAAKNPTAPVVP